MPYVCLAIIYSLSDTIVNILFLNLVYLLLVLLIIPANAYTRLIH